MLTAAAATAFILTMHRYQESPQRAWERIVHSIFQKEAAPTEEPSPTEEAAQPTPRPDALAWLVQHKDYWPKEVTLREPTQFPAVSGGKEVGSVNVPAGSTLRVVDITVNDIETDYLGGKRRVSISATDLRSRAEAALVRSERERQLGKGMPVIAGAPSPKPPPEQIREASSEEIRNGLGAMYTAGETTFRIFAPNARTVSLILYDEPTGDAGRNVQSLPMFRLRTKSDVRSRVNFIEQSNHATLMYTVSGEGIAGETWKRACVVLNSADSSDAELILPGGEWNVALDDHGVPAEQRSIAGKINLRFKSGAILYHQ